MQRRGGACAEQRHLLAVALQRVPGDEEPDYFLFTGKPLALGPWRHVGQLRRTVLNRGQFAEERFLAGVAIGLLELGLLQRRLQRLEQLLAMAAERVTGTGGDEGLDHPLVAEPEVDALHQVGQRLVPARAPPCDDRLDGAAAHVAHGAQPETDPLVRHDGELEPRFVHVGREDLATQLARLVDVLHHLVGVADFRESSAAMNSTDSAS